MCLLALLASPARAQQGGGGAPQAPDAAAAPADTAADAPADAAAEDAPPDAPLALRPTPRLAEPLPPGDASAPTFVLGERITGRTGLETVVEGQAELRKPGLVLKSDRLSYDETSAIASATGGVRINAQGNRYTGSEGRVQVDAFEGFVLQPTYHFLATGGHGQAERIDFHDPDRATTWQGNYTTCQRGGPAWAPDWLLRASRLDIDQAEGVGRAEGAVLEFKGLPILPLPSISFPISNQRKSGWLPPTIGLDSTSGLNLALPYYWNIAPQRDATFTPHLMLRRGLDMGGEFRYLEPAYGGRVDAHYMPGDRLRHRDRWGLFARHNGTLDSGIGPLGLGLNLNRVSDDNHWRDFSQRGLSLTSRLLANEGSLSWARGSFSLTALASKWQTLQTDDVSLIIPPYDRLPQIVARYARVNDRGFDYLLEADHTRFLGDRALIGQPNANRSFVRGQLARPFLRPWGFFTPKVQLHSTHYRFDAPLPGGATSASRTVPTLSLDGGLIFERDARYFGRALRQTLEPRLLYVYTPYRNQSLLPNYDSGAYDFNFATIWADNAFAGHDRIVDNNLFTAGVTSRLLDADTGAEAVRLSFAQRYRINAQRVTLPGGQPAGKGWSDMMLGASLSWDPRWAFDTVQQYNPDNRRITRSTWQGRYMPGPYRTLSLAYRHQRDLNSEYIDLGWQWPLGGGPSAASRAGQRGELGARRHGGGSCSGSWYSVGRLNYSLAENRLVDGVLGIEYDAGCWVGRVVLEKTSRSTTSSTKRIMFQLEFVGLSRIGSSPINTLRNHIPRYQPLRHEVTTPSRFTEYD